MSIAMIVKVRHASTIRSSRMMVIWLWYVMLCDIQWNRSWRNVRCLCHLMAVIILLWLTCRRHTASCHWRRAIVGRCRDRLGGIAVIGRTCTWNAGAIATCNHLCRRIGAEWRRVWRLYGQTNHHGIWHEDHTNGRWRFILVFFSFFELMYEIHSRFFPLLGLRKKCAFFASAYVRALESLDSRKKSIFLIWLRKPTSHGAPMLCGAAGYCGAVNTQTLESTSDSLFLFHYEIHSKSAFLIALLCKKWTTVLHADIWSSSERL